MSLAWLLNLDADDELADSNRVAISPEVEARVRSFGLLTQLAIEGDVVIGPGVRADGLEARAWMPTPRALARIADSGAIVPAAPRLEVLRRVNHRAFAIEIGPALEGSLFTTSIEEALAAVDRPTEGGWWLLKTAHGYAGRGRKLVHEGRVGRDVRRFLTSAIQRAGGVTIEPWLLRRTADFAIHGFVATDGSLVLGAPTTQRCDEAGVWRESSVAGAHELAVAERDALLDAAARVAGALTRAGYFGPFGVDAFRYLDEQGNACFHPLCEINARYTMGFAIGMGPRRPDRLPSPEQARPPRA